MGAQLFTAYQIRVWFQLPNLRLVSTAISAFGLNIFAISAFSYYIYMKTQQLLRLKACFLKTQKSGTK